MKIKSLLSLLIIGLTLGFTAPRAIDAMQNSDASLFQAAIGGIESIGSKGRISISSAANEDFVVVGEIDSSPDYDETSKEELACVGEEHIHRHYNNSTDNPQQEFWGVVHSFAIALDTDYPGGSPSTNDFLTNVDTDTMVCTNGNSIYVDCSFDKNTTSLGTVIYNSTTDSSNTDRWSGTTITYQELDWISGSPRGLLWKYGTSSSTDIDLKPWLASGNYKLEAIAFEPEAYDTDGQTATTESWTKMEFFFINPAEDYSDEDNWIHTYTDDVQKAIDSGNDVDPDDDYIYWYGLNARLRSIWPKCEDEEGVQCTNLEVTPSDLSVDDVYDNTVFDVVAYDVTGNDITADLLDQNGFTYESADINGGVGNNIYKPGLIGYRDTGSNSFTTTNYDSFQYRNAQPGDTLHIKSVDFPKKCSAELEYPYCADLNLENPTDGVFIYEGTSYEDTIEINASAGKAGDSSYSEEWPYDITYSSTSSHSRFDGNAGPYTLDQSEGAWTVGYTGPSSATVTIEAEDDLAGLCLADFSYVLQNVACRDLTLTSANPISVTAMEAGDVEISWASTMIDGSPRNGPWNLTSTNPNGSFTDPGGMDWGTGSVTAYPAPLVYYNGQTGDVITIEDIDYENCFAIVTSESLEEYACTDLALEEDPDLIYSDGTVVQIDLTDNDDLSKIYDENYVCWDFEVNVDNAAYGNVLYAEATSGTLDLTVTETGGSDSGNPASVSVTGETTYTGTLCWADYTDDSYVALYMYEEEDVCYDEANLLPYAELPYCEYLSMDPDAVTITATETDAGTVDLTIDVAGDGADWLGVMIVEVSGSGSLLYSDGSASEFGDGHLEIPVGGTGTTVNLSFVGGLEGDIVTAYIEAESETCYDSFTVYQEGEVPVCELLEFNVNQFSLETPGGNIETTLTLNSELDDQTLFINYTGCEGLIEYGGSAYSKELEITNIDGSKIFNLNFTKVCTDAVINTYVEDEEEVCADGIEVLAPEEVLACLDFSFDVEEAGIVEGQDLATTLTLTSQLEKNLAVVTYEACDGTIEYGSASYDGELITEIGSGVTTLDVTFTDICEDAEIDAFIRDWEAVCSDSLALEALKMGEFNKYIYTFNFSAEKNAYSDDGIFFSHDEDRAFYTLEYDPAGTEDEITFTDEMWDGLLEGHKGSGDPSDGNVSLARSYDELTSVNYYTYSTITQFGFGDTHETNSDALADYVRRNYSKLNFMTYVPYIKYGGGSESEPIEACEDDEDEEICYDSDESPEVTRKVVIRNVGQLEDKDDDATVRVRYVGIVDSQLDCSAEDDDCLTEEFENEALVFVYDNVEPLEDTARLVVLCPYLVTRNAGDVFLETDLKGGSDIACIFAGEGEDESSDYRNVDALIIQDSNDSDSTGFNPYSSAYSDRTVSFCDDADSGGVIGNLSSYVCEIITSVSELWERSTVESTTEGRISQSTRNTQTGQGTQKSFNDWNSLETALKNQNNPNSGILYYSGTGEGDSLTLGEITVPEGAWTVIVENADLVLNGNIFYADTEDYTNIPSIAFVVTGGDIYIAHTAGLLSGVYYTDQSFDGDERSPVNEQLEIYGSIYGHIQPLLDAADYVGPATLDGGGIVVRYDSRIILNTPPGLSEYVDINTEQAVN